MTFSIAVAWVVFVGLPLLVALIVWAVHNDPLYSINGQWMTVYLLFWVFSGWWLFG